MTKYKIVFSFEIGINSKEGENITALIERARTWLGLQAIGDPSFSQKPKLLTWEKVEENEQKAK